MGVRVRVEDKFPLLKEGIRNNAGGIFLPVGENLTRSEFDISKLKTALFEYWTSIKTKISMTCVSKEYEIKIKMVQEQ